MDPRTTYDGQTKFNFYLVALAFSILGLAIQSFDRKTGGLPRVLELVAWAMLLFSALLALSYVEWSSKWQDLAAIRERRDEARHLTWSVEKEPSGSMPSGRKVIEGAQQAINQLETHETTLIETLSSKRIPEKVKYELAKWSFVAGILVLAVARILQYLV